MKWAMQSPVNESDDLALFVSIRRSGPIAETFVWDVAFDTSFEKVSLQ